MNKKIYTLANREQGQMVLLTLLVLTVAVTLVLAFVGRSTVDTVITNQTEDSARAFNAAEAGIESALKNGVNAAEVLSGGAQYSATVVSLGGAASAYEFPKKTSEGSSDTLWLVEHNADGTLDEASSFTQNSVSLCWTQESVTPALIVSLIYKRSGSTYVARAAYDDDATRRAINNFSAPSSTGTGCGKSNMYIKSINFGTDFGVNPVTDTLLMMRIKPVYAGTSISFDPNGTLLPVQAKRIESVGSVGSGVSRKIVVYQPYRSPSSLFDYVLYSQGSLGN